LVNKNNVAQNTTKTCNKCYEEKQISEFHKHKKNKDGHSGTCKGCAREINKQYRKDNQEILRQKRKEYYENNKEEILEKQRLYYEENKDYINERSRAYYDENREYLLEKGKEWYWDNREYDLYLSRMWYEENKDHKSNYDKKYHEENKERRRKQSREWRQDNPEKKKEINDRWKEENKEWYKKCMRDWKRRKYKEDSHFRMSLLIRAMLQRIKNAQSDNVATRKDLCYGPDELKMRLEYQFHNGMSWDNYGEWHIDHKIPIQHFLNKGETRPHIINALSNLQPLWATDNIKKGSKFVYVK